MTYAQVLEKIYKGDLSKIPEILLALDPGETTGYAIFKKGQLQHHGQLDTVTIDKQPKWNPLTELFYHADPTQVVCENYRIYSHKLDRHSFSQVLTLRLIGGIDFLCRNTYGISKDPILIDYLMAAQAKGFATDERLKEWGFWQSGMKHARDAIRHGLYWLIITNRPKGGK